MLLTPSRSNFSCGSQRMRVVEVIVFAAFLPVNKWEHKININCSNLASIYVNGWREICSEVMHFTNYPASEKQPADYFYVFVLYQYTSIIHTQRLLVITFIIKVLKKHWKCYKFWYKNIKFSVSKLSFL